MDPTRPGLAPAEQRPAGTMFAALYGELVPHSWRGPEPGSDAYSLFHQRALAMGWLDDAEPAAGGGTPGKQEAGASGLWSMNDAGWDHPLVPAEARLASWFQVEVGAVPHHRSLPVQPFLHCAGNATERAGTLRLEAVQLLLPVQGLDSSARPHEALLPPMRAIHWFREGDPRSRSQVEIGVNSGRDPVLTAGARQFADRLGRLAQDVFAWTSYDTGRPGAVPAPPFDDGFWNGPPLNGVTLRGELAEWSLDAIGWLGELIADSGARLGVRSPLLVTATRSPGRP